MQGKMAEAMLNVHLETQIQEHAVHIFLIKAKIH